VCKSVKYKRLLEVSLHVILILTGILLIYNARGQTDEFLRDTYVNVGSDLIAVTVVFFLFRLFSSSADSENETQSKEVSKPLTTLIPEKQVLVDDNKMKVTSNIPSVSEKLEEEIDPDLKGALKGRSATSQTQYPKKDY
jgi:hypothetical protein